MEERKKKKKGKREEGKKSRSKTWGMDEEKRVNSAWIKGPSGKIKISQPTEGRKSRNNDMQRMPALQHVKGRRRGKQPCHAMQMSLRVGRQSTSASRTAFSPYFCLYFRLYFRYTSSRFVFDLLSSPRGRDFLSFKK